MRKRSRLAVHILLVVVISAPPMLWPEISRAAPLTTKSVTISDSAPGAVNTHRFNFNINTVTSVGSIEFEYCSNTPFVGTVCTAPTGFSASSAVLSSQTGETGFSIDPSSTSNRIVLSRPAGLTSAIPVSYTFDTITNHSAPFNTVYVRLATFASSDGTGLRTDSGPVAYATVGSLSVSGYVPPHLTFCVGVTVALNCSSSSGNFLNFGELSTSQPRYLTSQFSVSTNDPGGYVTSVAGTTMTSGNNIIPALGTPSPSIAGSSQFGMNLRANSSPGVGANPAGVGTGAITPNYSIPNQFMFNNQVIASSSISTDFNLFTTSYIVNRSASQSPGVYSTTLTYVAVAAF